MKGLFKKLNDSLNLNPPEILRDKGLKFLPYADDGRSQLHLYVGPLYAEARESW